MADKNEALEDILEGDYKFVLISGDYFDCPSCNDITSFNASTFYDEKELLNHIRKVIGSDYLKALYVLDSDNGRLEHYSDITTKAAGHKVTEIQFDLPSGRVMMVLEKGGYRQLDPAEVILYAASSNN